MSEQRDSFTVRQFRDPDVPGRRAFEVQEDPEKERHYDWFDAIESFARRFRITRATVHGKREDQ